MPLRSQCTSRKTGGRTLSIYLQEDFWQRLRELPATVAGRAALRKRVGVEHGLAYVSQRQGNEARYCGTRKNTYHLRLVCAIQNQQKRLTGLSSVSLCFIWLPSADSNHGPGD